MPGLALQARVDGLAVREVDDHQRPGHAIAQRAHDENPVFHDTRQLSLWDAVLALRLKLYDEHSGRLVSFAEAHQYASRPEPQPSRPPSVT